jgi:gag-polypeptide of LTR copia-type
MRQDQLLLAWPLSTISEAVVPQVVHCLTAADLWHELYTRYSSQSLARVMDLNLQVQSLQKGHLSMQQYLDQKRSLVDRFRLIGSPISDADLQLFILHGLNVMTRLLFLSTHDQILFPSMSCLTYYLHMNNISTKTLSQLQVPLHLAFLHLSHPLPLLLLLHLRPT